MDSFRRTFLAPLLFGLSQAAILTEFKDQCFNCLTSESGLYYCATKGNCYTSASDLDRYCSTSSSIWYQNFLDCAQLSTLCATEDSNPEGLQRENRIILSQPTAGEIYQKAYSVKNEEACLIMLANTTPTDYLGRPYVEAKFDFSFDASTPMIYRQLIPQDYLGSSHQDESQLEETALDATISLVPRNFTYLYIFNNHTSEHSFTISYSAAQTLFLAASLPILLSSIIA